MLDTGPGRPGPRPLQHGELSVDLPGGGGNPVLFQVQLEDRGGGAVLLISRDRLACCARVMKRLSR
jgi:hypothetical protein